MLLRLLSSGRLSGPVNLILAAVLGYHATAAVLALVQPLPPLPVAAVATAPVSPLNMPRTDVALGPLIKAHLFGRPAAPVETVAPPVIPEEEAPETALNLKLQGVLHSEVAAETRAVILLENGKTRLFTPGDEVEGGALLRTVHPDRVLLERNGRYETLSLVQTKDPKQREQMLRHVPDPAATAANGAKLAEYRNKILQRPESMTRYVRLQPARANGHIIGYTLRSGREHGLLEQFGLQSGDVVTAVNGTSLDSPVRGLKAMEALSSATRIELEILRKDSPMTFTFDLPAGGS